MSQIDDNYLCHAMFIIILVFLIFFHMLVKILNICLSSPFSYVQYSTIAARAVRQALKGEAKEAGVKRGNFFKHKKLQKNWYKYFSISDIVSIKFQKWEAGKPVGKKE